MRAAVITRAGDPEVLAIDQRPRPVPFADEVLVRVRASALNRADLLQRRGRYPAPPGVPPDIPGIEFAGDVEALGERVDRWRRGDRVFGLVAGGAHAEYLVAHERTLVAIPDNLDWADAAAVPEVFITAHDALITQANLRSGERVLIHAIGSGVGLGALQLARAQGSVPYGTARTPDKVERAAAMGLERGVALEGGLDALANAVTEWTGGSGMDVVLDLVGGPYVAASLPLLRQHGRMMIVGTIAGIHADLDLAMLLRARLTIRGTVLRARPLEEKILATRAFNEQVVPLLERGLVRPTVDRRFPLEEIAAAHRYLESNRSFGKVVIDVAV